MQLISILVFFGIVIVATILAVIYDVWVFMRHDQDCTISRGMAELGKEYPIFPFFAGIVIGALAAHFWWKLK